MQSTTLVSARVPVLLSLGLALVVLGSLPGTAQSPRSVAQSLHTRYAQTDRKTTDDNKDNKKVDKKDNDKANPFSAQEQTLDNRKWGVVLANDKPVMGVPVAAGGFSPLKRAQIVAERMQKLYQAGAKFRQTDNYVVGKLNGEIVLTLRPAKDTDKLELLFTIDSNLDTLLNSHNKGKRASRADIAFYWRDTLIKAIKEQTDIAAPLQDPDAWATIPPGYAHDMKLTPLRESQVHRPSGGR